MDTQRRSTEEQYQLVMEFRSSGLSDYQWCMKHDINPGTFYNWVSRLRHKACYDIPPSSGRETYHPAQKQEVVKLEVLPDIPIAAEPAGELPVKKINSSPIEIHSGSVSISISNDVDSRLLSQIIRNMTGNIC